MSVACTYCGLAVPAGWWDRSEGHQPAFCCFGCRFAFAVAQERQSSAGPVTMLARLGISIFFAMNVLAFSMTLWGEEVYSLNVQADPLASQFYGIFRMLCLLFSIPVLALLGGPLASDAWRSLCAGRPNADLLLLTGVVASFIASAASMFRGHGPVYFEVGVVVLVLVTLGRWLEATGKQRATAALEALQEQLPATARRMSKGVENTVGVAEVQAGDRLRILPGERIPCDGFVVAGNAAVDEKLVSGESVPRHRTVGDRVHGGSFDIDGELVVECTAPANAGALARLIAAVRAAGLARGRYQRLADSVSACFLPVVIALAITAAIVNAYRGGVDSGLMSGLAVLVIACPCALGVATPLAVWSAIGRLAQQGIVIGSGDAIERLAGIRVVGFDKTGTLTDSRSRVTAQIIAPGEDNASVAGEAFGLAFSTNHPHARAIAEHLRNGHRSATSNDHTTRTYPGRGVVRDLGADNVVMMGSPRLAHELSMTMPTSVSDGLNCADEQGQPVVVVAWEGAVRGAFVISEELRAKAHKVVNQLQTAGYHVVVLTGDSAARGALIGRKLGVEVRAGLLPEDKVQMISDLQKEKGPVAMVGDGLNDAPALAAADVGIALGCGAELTRETADVCLLGDDLEQIPTLLSMAKRTVHVIRQNLFWAFVYNLVGIGLAVSGRLSPVIAAAAMFLSSLFVVSNSWRLGNAFSAPIAAATPPREVAA